MEVSYIWSLSVAAALVVDILLLYTVHSRGTFLKDVVIVLEQILVRRQWQGSQ